MIGTLKRLIISSQLPDWRRDVKLEDGYSVLLPSPMDMPFMLRLGLEGLRHIDTSHCRQILIVPDGWGDDNGEGLRRVADEFDDDRIALVDLTQSDYRLIRAMRPPGCAATHWMQFVNGTKHACSEYAFLHDADAFFLDRGGLEAQYKQARDQEAYTLGVTPRWDPFFSDLDMSIPGTWELMYSVRWARSRHPYEFKGRAMSTEHGRHEFDSMLFPQCLDYPSGRVGVMETPPEFVHFNGTIFTYRLFRDAKGKPITDELFRVLLLSLIQEALELPEDSSPVPRVNELAKGLTTTDAKVGYRSDKNRAGYGEFRTMVDQMCKTAVFAGSRAEKVCELLRPFDDHFRFEPTAPVTAALSEGEMRVAGVQQRS